MNEKPSWEQDREEAMRDRRAEQTGVTPASLQRGELHQRPGYQAAVRRLGEAGLLDEVGVESRLSGEHGRRLREEPHEPSRSTLTQEQVIDENDRAWREMMGYLSSDRQDSGTTDQLELPIDE